MMVASALSATTSKAFGAVTRSAGWGTTRKGDDDRKRGGSSGADPSSTAAKRRGNEDEEHDQVIEAASNDANARKKGGRNGAPVSNGQAPAVDDDDETATATRTPPPSSASKTRKSVTLSLPDGPVHVVIHPAAAGGKSPSNGVNGHGGSPASSSGKGLRVEMSSPSTTPGMVASLPSSSSALSTPNFVANQHRTANAINTSHPVALLTTSKSDDLLKSNKKVDRFGFIRNMDANGNLLGEDDDVLDDDFHETASRRGSPTRSGPLPLPWSSSPRSPSSPLHRVVPSRMAPYSEIQRNQRREVKWEKMIDTYYNKAREPPRNLLLRRCRKGLPHSIRGRVWKLLGSVPAKITQHPGLYEQLVRKTIVGAALSTVDGALSSPSPSPTASVLKPLLPTSCSDPSAADTATVASIGPSSSVAGDDNSLLPEAEPMNHTKSFRNLQDTIERDIHRTFPRHSLFYEESDASVVAGAGTADEHDGNEGGGLQVGLCGTTDISSMIRELELGQLQEQQELGIVAPNEADLVLSAQGGQASLRRVLKAYSLYDREIGYCQGMNFIAGMFLTLMSEEEAFWLLVDVMHDAPCRMRGLFGEGMRETHQVLHVAERLIHQFLPRLAKHLDKEHIHITMFATQWLLTQYTSSFRFDLVLRVWDCFLAEGWKVTYRVMLCLLQRFQSDILKMGFEDILAFFRELPDRVDGNAVVDESVKIPLKRKHILQYEKEWQRTQQPASH